MIGRAFSVELLEAMEQSEPDALLDAIEDAERARLIVPAPDPSGEDRLIFAHELIRQTLLRRPLPHPPPAPPRPHRRRPGAPLLRQPRPAGGRHRPPPPRSATAGDAGRAYRYLLRAGRWAMEGSAFEEAVRHYQKASTIEGVTEPAERAELLFELGTARRSAGHWDTAIDAWRQSADAYEELDDAEAVGRVCLAAAYNLGWAARWIEAVEMAQRGLGSLGERISADRARLLGTAGFPAAYGGHYQTSAEMIDEELTLAAQLADDGVLGHGLSSKAMALVAYMEHREAADSGLRAAELLRAAGDLWNLAGVLGFVLLSLTYLGRFDEVRTLSEEVGPLAERLGNYGAIMQHRRMNALVDFFTSGDIDRFEAFAARDREFCESAGFTWVSSSWSWLGLAQFLRGEWDEAKSLFEQAVRLEAPGTLDGWNASLLFECLAYRGEKAEALALLEPRALPLPGEPKPWGGVSMLLSAVEGLTVLDEPQRAAELYPSVVDVFERTGVVCPPYDDGRLYERAAGIAALAGRRWEAAEAHFRTALRQAAELPHRPEEAHTRRWYGQMLLERNGPGDREQAEKVLHQAVEDYERMGMPRHRELAAALLRG